MVWALSALSAFLHILGISALRRGEHILLPQVYVVAGVERMLVSTTVRFCTSTDAAPIPTSLQRHAPTDQLLTSCSDSACQRFARHHSAVATRDSSSRQARSEFSSER